MNAIIEIFLEVTNLLCMWHIDKNMLANLKKHFRTEGEWEEFMKQWWNLCTLRRSYSSMIINVEISHHSGRVLDTSNVCFKLPRPPLLTHNFDGAFNNTNPKSVEIYTQIPNIGSESHSNIPPETRNRSSFTLTSPQFPSSVIPPKPFHV
jgi:hypothetical protein